MSDFSGEVEDVKLNQYWSSNTTNAVFVREIQMYAKKVAFLSTPSIYFSLTDDELRQRSKLFEFDRRWQNDSGFVFYDFNKPESIPVDLFGEFDYIVVDPPFITEEVWTKYMATVKLLSCGEHCRYLFTSVLENHQMLETLNQGALFIGAFQPSIPHLTYQYHCFTNYLPSYNLTQRNPELPSQEPKILAGIEFANGIRESEKDFHRLMQIRDRTGEVPLPKDRDDEAFGSANAAADSALSAELSRDPAMKWKTVPAGLTEHASTREVEGSAIESAELKNLERRRNLMDEFKKCVDKAFLHLDAHAKAKSDAARATALSEKASTLNTMIAAEKELSELSAEDKDGICSKMRECIAELSSKPFWNADELKEIGADATRKYKSPVFNRMKELLAQMKAAKKTAMADAARGVEAA